MADNLLQCKIGQLANWGLSIYLNSKDPACILGQIYRVFDLSLCTKAQFCPSQGSVLCGSREQWQYLLIFLFLNVILLQHFRLTLVMLNRLRCQAHFQFSANQIS